MNRPNWICKQCADNCALEKLENVQIETPPFDCPWGLQAKWHESQQDVSPDADEFDFKHSESCACFVCRTRRLTKRYMP